VTGAEIRSYREARGLTQAGLARALSVDGTVAPNTVARWERGERRPPPFLRLALRALRRRTLAATP
jgi:transcriptional regulator with XRE-family HTH domain